ncbi:thioredoxin domain-containing protein 3 [Cavia porcellus]|uniref:thioredoxin domain-containing protein 3 n=1 Tax=Cavia porcellus TaxID=10141 RepID=UPI00022B580C|nr:thioredoxin domain-containing protein 3 [Cavia porcellus]
MASKKRGEVQLQTVINSQTLWDEMLQNKGLTVIDVYQAWCGPCKAMQPLFRKLKNEINEDEILHFAVAEADNIVTLQSFKDKCEPVFLFSVNGKIIAKIQGANAPLVNKKVSTLINEEKKIAAGEMIRPEVILVPLLSQYNETVFSLGEIYYIVIIKPDAVLKTKPQEIKEKITAAGFVIEAEDKIMLTEEQVRDFYSQIEDEPDFEDFLSFMTTGLSHVLVIAQIKDQMEESDLELEGPSEPPTASGAMKWKSLEECLEQQHISQFCDVEDNEAKVAKLTDVFFPDFKITKSKKLQKTLALLRPDILENQDDVLQIIKNEGFTILMGRQIVLSEEAAKMLCEEYEKETYYEKLIETMTRSPSLALVLLRDNGVQHWKELLGPKSVEEIVEYNAESLCAQFAMGSLPINQLYGSDSTEAAERDIQYFFPPEDTFALIKPHVTHEQRGEILKLIKDEGFELTQLKELYLTPEQVERIYVQIVNKDFYKDVLQVLSEGPTVVMVLTKWNAIADWRRLMGPVDPEEAKLLSPDSIRARFGINILKNGVHGATNLYSVTESISAVFGEDAGEQ